MKPEAWDALALIFVLAVMVPMEIAAISMTEAGSSGWWVPDLAITILGVAGFVYAWRRGILRKHK